MTTTQDALKVAHDEWFVREYGPIDAVPTGEYHMSLEGWKGHAKDWTSVENPPKPFTPVAVQLKPKRKNEKKPRFAIAEYCVPKPGYHEDDNPGWFDSSSEIVDPLCWKYIVPQ